MAARGGTTSSHSFILACQKGDVDAVNEFVAQGGDVDHQNEEAVCGLFEAAKCGHVDVVGTLIKNGADVNKGNGKAVVLLWLVRSGEAQLDYNETGVCNRTVAWYQLRYQSQSHQYSYSCGGWLRRRRCTSVRYSQAAVTTTHYYTVYECCSGFRNCDSNNNTCCPVCNPPCINGGDCASPDVCECLPGWTGDACQTDINECHEMTDGCQQECVNTNGSYMCACRSGYRLLSDGHSCIDIDECSEGIDRCDQNCHNAVGSYACSCDNGYRINNTFTCNDIDECAEGTAECDDLCYNTIGSYSCNCTGPGYRLHSDGVTCENINECTEGIDGCVQVCTDTDGSYSCSCNSGYYLKDDNHGCGVSGGVPFQIRFFLSDDLNTDCSNYVGENHKEKIHDIALVVGDQIAKLCDCHYSETLINSRQFFCNNDNNDLVIFQARLFPTYGKRSEMIRSITEEWVQTEPFIVVGDKSYQLDPNCSVVIKEIGDTSCNANLPDQLSSGDKLSVVMLGYYIGGGGGGVLLLVILGIVIGVTCCLVKRYKSKKASFHVRHDNTKTRRKSELDNPVYSPNDEDQNVYDAIY